MKAQHCAMPVSASQINLTWTDNSSGGPHNRRALTLRLESEPSHFIYLKFDEFASVQGSSKLIRLCLKTRILPIMVQNDTEVGNVYATRAHG